MIGLLGGTFDPVHFGHLQPTQEVYRALNLEKVLFIPAANPPHRSPPIAGIDDRINMLNLVMPMYDGFEMDDRERKMGGLSYTVRTLESLRAEKGDQSLGLIMGADAFAGFEDWYQWQSIPELAHLIIMNRPGARTKKLPEWALPRATEDNQRLETEAAGLIRFVQVKPLNISATAIRRLLADGESVEHMLPEVVLKYIEKNGLYK